MEKRWTNPTGLAEIEKALDNQCLYAAMRNGKWWLCRRNGATKLWKTRPADFRIPIKVGFRSYHAITQADDMANYRIAGSREDAEHST